MTREQAVRALQAEYEQVRARNRAQEQRRLAEVETKSPAIVRALRQREALLKDCMRDAFDHPADAERISAELAGRMRALHEEARQALAKSGFPAGYLEPVYACSLCRDKGEVGEPLRRWCSCFQQRLTRMLCSDEGMAALQAENFDAFDETLFPDDDEVLPAGTLPGVRLTQRIHMRGVRETCERYADAFPDTARRNMLFFGPSGLGKSFLMNCVAHRVLDRGFSVVRTTAPKLVEVMRRYHYSGEGAEQMTQWTQAQLLVLDDLGMEPMIENVTIVYLFNLLNDRLVTRRHTLVSTNLNKSELVRAYTERLASRLLDTHTTLLLPFAGRDLRLMPKI
ncbi:MAG: ATP-binding protein [Clostridia bacterium]|nr:ATP-binding protein [Clostridia bacterium]